MGLARHLADLEGEAAGDPSSAIGRESHAGQPTGLCRKLWRSDRPPNLRALAALAPSLPLTALLTSACSVTGAVTRKRDITQLIMGIFAILELAIKHPEELRAMVTYKVWRDPLNDIKSNPEESGWNRETMRDCWTLLDQTSRSFAAVIKELKGQLSRFICIFYLVLRALDTIEDDMTIEPARKIQLLVNFYKKLEEPGWNFTESELYSLPLSAIMSD